MSKLKRISGANAELTEKLNFAVNQNRELLNCVAAILMEHHGGKVNISPHHVTQTKGWARTSHGQRIHGQRSSRGTGTSRRSGCSWASGS